MDPVVVIGQEEEGVFAPAGPGPADFVVRLAQALHRQGMACHHLESLLGRVAERLSLKSHMLSLQFPTGAVVIVTGLLSGNLLIPSRRQ